MSQNESTGPGLFCSQSAVLCTKSHFPKAAALAALLPLPEVQAVHIVHAGVLLPVQGQHSKKSAPVLAVTAAWGANLLWPTLPPLPINTKVVTWIQPELSATVLAQAPASWEDKGIPGLRRTGLATDSQQYQLDGSRWRTPPGKNF